MAFEAPHFNELGFSFNFDLTLMSFCTQGLPGVAEFTLLKRGKKTSSWVKVLAWSIESLGKGLLSGLHPQSVTVPPLPEGEGNLLENGFCDFAFGFAQNDRVVWGAAKSQSFRTRETNRKGV